MPNVNSADGTGNKTEPRQMLNAQGDWYLFCGFWVLVSLASVLEMTILRSAGLAESLRFASTQWVPWVLLTPIIVWITSLHPLDRLEWRRAIWVHLSLCAVTVTGLGVLAYLSGPPPMPQRSQAERHRFYVESWTPGFVILRRATSQLPIFWGVVGVAHALLFSHRARERGRRETELERSLAQARLQALRMQLNPHFLFNTLNSIASLAHQDPLAAEEMIVTLSDLLRIALRAPDRQEVSLREELGFLDRYLLIEKARFGERLRIEKEIEPAALDAAVPVLILQPLVENAVKHGIEARLTSGIISIVARREGDSLHLQVTDNGPGINGGAGTAPKEGVGLSNTRSRLKELYGARGSMKLQSPSGGGFLVEVQVPWRAETAPPTVMIPANVPV